MSQRSQKSSRPQTRLDPAVRRAQLVDAASRVFRHRDPTEVSFEEVADAAGVSRSLVYAYFGDRGGLIAAVYLHDLRRLDEELGRAVDGPLLDEMRARWLVRRYLQFAQDNRDSWQLLASVGALQHPAVQAAKRARIERVARLWGGGTDARLVARAVVGLLEASAEDWLAHGDVGLDRVTEIVHALLWTGLSGLHDRGVATAS